MKHPINFNQASYAWHLDFFLKNCIIWSTAKKVTCNLQFLKEEQMENK